MATHCQIIVEGNDGVCIYQHSNGYPDTEHGVLATLLPIVRGFAEVRGHDPEYLSAQIVHTFVSQKGNTGRYNGRYTGFGISASMHGDEEYVYVVRKDRVEVRRTGSGFWGAPTLVLSSVVKTVDLDGEPIA